MTSVLTDAVTYEVVRGVAWVTINRPEARNALNKAVRDGLFDQVRRFNADDEAKVLVLTGAGDRAFCAGGDLKEMADNALTVPPRSSAATSRWSSRPSRRSTALPWPAGSSLPRRATWWSRRTRRSLR